MEMQMLLKMNKIAVIYAMLKNEVIFCIKI